MEKTGESYTTARAQLRRKKEHPDYAKLAGMSDETVRAKTGRSWGEWVRTLDAIGAASKPHRDIANHVYQEHGIPGWWAQTVTVGYERIRGLREIGQRRSGSFEASKSKTFPVPVGRLYRAFHVARTRARWLPNVDFVVRKATPEKSMRVSWQDGSSVELYFTAKGARKSQVAIQHVRLSSKAEAANRKAYWTERLNALEALLSA
jgi:uncharacterized protein YndB with AHSA1/START domain